MAKLSKRLMNGVRREVRELGGAEPLFLDLAGHCIIGNDRLSVLDNSRRRRSYALQESINLSEPYIYQAAPGIAAWVLGLEDRRMILGSMVGAEVFLSGDDRVTRDETIAYLAEHGMGAEVARDFVDSLPVMDFEEVRSQAHQAQDIFYRLSGWKAELMEERSRKLRQQKQISQAVEDVRRRGGMALYTFEKERILLSNIKAGDRNTSRRILNEMLAAIYMSAPQIVVLRARVVELLACLVRAAIEDNPLMEPLLERNHMWTEQLIHSGSFEELSDRLMRALDDFIDGIYLHGVNRSNLHVHKALDFIGDKFAEPISLKDVAEHVGLSSCRLAHLMKDYTGLSVMQTIRNTRIRRAQLLLRQSTKSCAEIGYEVGFGDQSYFTYHFRRQTGVTPARYRKEHG